MQQAREQKSGSTLSHSVVQAFQERFTSAGQDLLQQARISPEVALAYEGRCADEIITLAGAGIAPEVAQPYYALQKGSIGFTSQDIICFAENNISPALAAAYAHNGLRSSSILELYFCGIPPDDERLLAYAQDGIASPSAYAQYVLRGMPLSWYQQKSAAYERAPSAKNLTAAFVQEQVPKPSQRQLKKNCNLTTYARYSGPLLEEMVRNLDSFYQHEKPIALVIGAKNDPHAEFCFGNLQAHLAIAERYKLFICEARHREEAFQFIERFALYHGEARHGIPKKPIELLLLSGHGNRYALNLGKTPFDDRIKTQQLPKYQESYLSVLDRKRFRCLAPFVSGTVLLDSCATGEGGAEVENLATCLFEALPIKALYAPMGDLRFLIMNNAGAELVPFFSCGKNKTLVLER